MSADAAPTPGGPLRGLRVLEFAGIGPGPFCGMLLADLGADVLRIDRPQARAKSMARDVTGRGKRSVVLDLKNPQDRDSALALIGRADVLIEGYRPGVMEGLGLGPDVALERNPALVYGRLTGWGQDGPLAHAAGHDINYIALTGALASVGEQGRRPVPPLNLAGDYGGGAMYLMMGVLSALYERQRSGRGQVIDAAMVDGAASLMSVFSWMQAEGLSRVRRGDNVLDGSAHYYRTYACADGRFISLGTLEPQFYELLWHKLGDDAPAVPPTQAKADWARGSEELEAIFKRRTRDAWTQLLEGSDVCFAPVMEFDEAHEHPHMRARGNFVEAYGVRQPAPAPRFSRTPAAIQRPPPEAGGGAAAALSDWGVPLSHAPEPQVHPITSLTGMHP
ncbi:CaiB/BaiF CoA-transferase family protein [Hydrogenophaga sp.]|uniref:CaiB/BaiF CoA transferase family protein n=1 Tax=Hydrogenophaga sp. TaxID=1904254 RepID=UPI0027271312|nr:CaiB/BaiF CoA-transferase family protein [Hydrogenophaga sp.]MDO9439059.1 CaiB/BaiF CoA-transferase family protein [Hydrogenophaga sp.]